MDDQIDDHLAQQRCPEPDCPSIVDLLLYAKGFYSSLDENDFNKVEEAIFERNCQQCLGLCKAEAQAKFIN